MTTSRTKEPALAHAPLTSTSAHCSTRRTAPGCAKPGSAGTRSSIRQGRYLCNGTAHSVEADVRERSRQALEALTERYMQDSEYVLPTIYLLRTPVNSLSGCSRQGCLRLKGPPASGGVRLVISGDSSVRQALLLPDLAAPAVQLVIGERMPVCQADRVKRALFGVVGDLRVLPGTSAGSPYGWCANIRSLA